MAFDATANQSKLDNCDRQIVANRIAADEHEEKARNASDAATRAYHLKGAEDYRAQVAIWENLRGEAQAEKEAEHHRLVAEAAARRKEIADRIRDDLEPDPDDRGRDR